MAGWEVRPSDPRRAGRMRLVLLLLLLAIPAAFYGGTWWQLRVTQSIEAEHQPMQERLIALEQELDVARIGYRGELKAIGEADKAEMARVSASNAKQAGAIGAISAITKTGASLLSSPTAKAKLTAS